MITDEFYFGTATDCLDFIRNHCDSIPIGNRSGGLHKTSILSITNHSVSICHVLSCLQSSNYYFHYSLSTRFAANTFRMLSMPIYRVSRWYVVYTLLRLWPMVSVSYQSYTLRPPLSLSHSNIFGCNCDDGCRVCPWSTGCDTLLEKSSLYVKVPSALLPAAIHMPWDGTDSISLSRTNDESRWLTYWPVYD